MARISEFSKQDHIRLERTAQSQTRACAALENAAQAFTHLLYTTFEEDVVLARLFVTVPRKDLPASIREFADNLAASAEIGDRMSDDTLVLSLAGSSGAETPWNDRRSSQGHVGIPLATADFIEAIPMMSRLLRELGLGLDWIESGDTSIVARSLGSSSGVFYVRDAVTETDHRGRKIIAAQDFVAAQGVKTVFGMGGAYMGTPSFLVCIVFCRTEVERSKVEGFMGLVNRIKVSTLEHARQGRIFAN